MLKNLSSQAALGWLGRRALDWGGWLGTIIAAFVGFYSTLGPAQQEAILSALTGNWQDITLGTLVPFVALVVSQVMSFRATVIPHVVTDDGTTVAAKKLSQPTKQRVEKEAQRVTADRKSLLERLFG